MRKDIPIEGKACRQKLRVKENDTPRKVAESWSFWSAKTSGEGDGDEVDMVTSGCEGP